MFWIWKSTTIHLCTGAGGFGGDFFGPGDDVDVDVPGPGDDIDVDVTGAGGFGGDFFGGGDVDVDDVTDPSCTGVDITCIDTGSDDVTDANDSDVTDVDSSIKLIVTFRLLLLSIYIYKF